MAGLFFYWGTYILVGARMYFESFPLLVLMTARGIVKTPLIVSRWAGPPSRVPVKGLLAGLLVLFTLFAFAFTFPRWVKPARTKSYYEVLTADFYGVSRRINDTIVRLPLGRSLVIMKFLYTPRRYFPHAWWASGFLCNDPGLRNRIIYAQDRGAANIEHLRCHPDRDIYLFVGTLEKGLLAPLKAESGRLMAQEPILFQAPDADLIELVGTPEELFNNYSDDFRRHIEAACAEHPFYELDVGRLVELSKEREARGDTAAAASCLEAALQVENDPFVRSQLLGQLAVLYRRRGDRPDARRIEAALADLYEPRVYDVFPEKGF